MIAASVKPKISCGTSTKNRTITKATAGNKRKQSKLTIKFSRIKLTVLSKEVDPVIVNNKLHKILFKTEAPMPKF